MTYYDTLEVARTASPETIEAAYRSLMLRYHPDKVAGLGADLQALATQRAQAINEAYAVLRSPAQRAAYDARLQATQAAKASTVERPDVREWQHPAAKPAATANIVRVRLLSVYHFGRAFVRNTKVGFGAVFGGAVLLVLVGLAVSKIPPLESLVNPSIAGFVRVVAVLFGIGWIMMMFCGVLAVLSGTLVTVMDSGAVAVGAVLVVRALLGGVAGILLVHLVSKAAGAFLFVQIVPAAERPSLYGKLLLEYGPYVASASAILVICLMPRTLHRWLMRTLRDF